MTFSEITPKTNNTDKAQQVALLPGKEILTASEFNALVQRLKTTPKVIFSATKKSHNIPTHTGTTAITDYFSFTVPANTIPEECVLRFNILIDFSKSSNYKFTTLVFNSENPNLNLLVYNQHITTNVSYYNTLHINRHMKVSNSKLLSNRDYKTNLHVGVSVEHTFNVSEPNVFRFFSKLDNANDSYTIEAITLEAIAPASIYSETERV